MRHVAKFIRPVAVAPEIEINAPVTSVYIPFSVGDKGLA
jgi:hypothetical protein